MRRLIVRVGVFVGIGLLLAAALTQLSHRYAPTSAYAVRVDELLEKSEEIEALAVGHSHNMALSFEAMGLRGYHLWIAGSDLFEADYQLRALMPLLPNVKVVFIPIAYGAFAHANDPDGWARRAYYTSTPTLRSFRLIDGDVKNLLRGKLAPLARKDHWKGIVQQLRADLGGGEMVHRPSPGYPRFVVGAHGYIGPDRQRTWSGKVPASQGAESTAEMQARIARATLERRPGITEDIYQTLVALTAYLREQEVRVVFYTPPYSKAYNTIYLREAPEQIETMSTLMNALKEHGAEYYNFSQEMPFTDNRAYFIDESHMSLYGAQRFSRRLARVLARPDSPRAFR